MFLKDNKILKGFLLVGLSVFSNQQIWSQQYIHSTDEFAVYSSLYLDSSSSWATSRDSVPGYFSWTIGGGVAMGYDNKHHINGYVKKYGPEAFTFPVGSGTDLRTLSITASGDSTAIYAVAWISGNPSLQPDPTNANALHPVDQLTGNLLAVSTLGQWDWMAVRGTGEGLTITVSIPEMTGDFSIASNLRLVGWNGEGWKILGSSGSNGITNGSLLTGIMTANIQAIGIGTITQTAGNPEDSDGDSITDAIEGYTKDTDKDGILDYLDNDDDGDGILTIKEHPDPNGDGNPEDALNTDGNGIPNYLDDDDDGDGIPSMNEHPDPNGDGNVNDALDTDGNGIPDYLQADEQNVDGLVVYNGLSTNTHENSKLRIEGIELFPDNTVSIYDRWGIMVYQTRGYNQTGNVFECLAGNSQKYTQGLQLQEDTYFYVIQYRKNGNEKYQKKSGYLYIRK